jgi:drug/metabolite transporter (DMT)-like permease
MSEHDFAIMALLLAGGSLLAALLARREGSERRDVRLLAGSAATLAGVGLVLLA